MQTTTAATTHEPTGDTDHVAYGADYIWKCTCGRTSAFVTSEKKQRHRAEQHEEYCMDDGEVTLDVVR